MLVPGAIYPQHLRRISGFGAQASDAQKVLLDLEVADGLLNNYTDEPAARERGAALQAQIIAEAQRQQALCNEG